MEKNIKSSGIRILLIRHGETEWNRIHRFQGRSDIPLNQRGKDQAHALALALKDESLVAIYSSPILRAIETARQIKAFHPSVPLFEEDALMEMDLGEFEGMEARRWASKFPNFRKAWLDNPAAVAMPGGESLQEVQDRAVDILKRITRLYPPGTSILICSHNFVILTILCYASKISLDRFRDLRQETAAISILYNRGDRFMVEVINERSHLQE